MKRTICWILTLCLLLTGLTVATYATSEVDTASASYYDGGEADTAWYVGHETDTEFTINSANQLKGLAELVNSGTETFLGKTVKLGCDIVWRKGTFEKPTTYDGSVTFTKADDQTDDEAKYMWIPIGQRESTMDVATVGAKSFQGSFDGQYHTISGLRTYAGGETICGGLFGLFLGKELKNLSVVNSAFDGKMAAGFAAAVSNEINATVRFENLYSDCTVRNVCNSANNAGIVGVVSVMPGEESGIYFEQCWANCTLTSKNWHSNSGFIGTVKGMSDSAQGKVSIVNCLMSGSVKTSNGGVAGLILSVSNANVIIKSTAVTGTVKHNNPNTTGGDGGAAFVKIPSGQKNVTLTISDSYYCKGRAQNNGTATFPIINNCCSSDETVKVSGEPQSLTKDDGTYDAWVFYNKSDVDNKLSPDIWFRDTVNKTLTLKPQNAVFIGTQTTAVTDGTYSVRFVAEIDGLNFNAAGFDVAISYGKDGSMTDISAQDLRTQTAYASVLAGGDKVEPTAEGRYLIALVVKNIPVSDDITTVTFTVTPYTVATNGQKMSGTARTVTLNAGN